MRSHFPKIHPIIERYQGIVNYLRTASKERRVTLREYLELGTGRHVRDQRFFRRIWKERRYCFEREVAYGQTARGHGLKQCVPLCFRQGFHRRTLAPMLTA